MPYKVIHKVFEDEEYAEEYALEAQDGRRNITQFKYTEKEIRRNDLKLRNEAKERQNAGKPLVFIASCKLLEFKVLENHWFSLLLEALGRQSIGKPLVLIAF